MRTAADASSAFVPTPSVRCMSPRAARMTELARNASVAECVQRCLETSRCVAIERHVPTARCTLLSECLHRERALNYMVGHYQPPPWPFPAAQMRWRTGVAIVVASYNRDITRIANLLEMFTPAADLVVYHKHDFNESRDVPSGWHKHALHECLPNATQRPLLSFLQILPNFGVTVSSNPNGTHGGSREPYAFLQFLLDFYASLPDAVLFSQDDTVCNRITSPHEASPESLLLTSRVRSVLLLRVPPGGWCNEQRGGGEFNVGAANRLGATLSTLLAGGAGGQAMLSKYASSVKRPDSESCLCIFNRNGHFNTTGYYSIVAGLRQHIFQTPSTSSNDPLDTTAEHTFPASARFAVGRADVLSRPRWVYDVLLRCTTAEKVWYWIGSSYLANVLERFWFVLFDARLTPRIANNNMSALPFRINCHEHVAATAFSWEWDFPTACEATRGAPRLGFESLVVCNQLGSRSSGCRAEV